MHTMHRGHVVYEDDDVVVYRGLNTAEVEKIVLDLFRKKRRWTFDELKRYFDDAVGTDRLRYVLNSLVSRGILRYYRKMNLYVLVEPI